MPEEDDKPEHDSPPELPPDSPPDSAPDSPDPALDPDFVDHEGPGEHDQRLLDEDEDETVPCPVCKADIFAYATECPRCGRDFGGEAWQVEADELPGAGGVSVAWIWKVSTLVVLGALAFLLLRRLG